MFIIIYSYTLYLHSYSQHGSIYSGLYSCSLGYVREFLNFRSLKGDVTAFGI